MARSLLSEYQGRLEVLQATLLRVQSRQSVLLAIMVCLCLLFAGLSIVAATRQKLWMLPALVTVAAGFSLKKYLQVRVHSVELARRAEF